LAQVLLNLQCILFAHILDSMQSLEEFNQQKWRDEATGRVHCINIEYWVNNASMLDIPDGDSEDEEEITPQVQPLASKLDNKFPPNARSKSTSK
jgi:hypothetical protein